MQVIPNELQFSAFDSTCPMDFQPFSAQQLPTSSSKEAQMGYILNKSEESKMFETKGFPYGKKLQLHQPVNITQIHKTWTVIFNSLG